MSRAGPALAVSFVGIALAGAAAAAPPWRPELRLEATFHHPLSTGSYTTRMGGVLAPEFRRLRDGSALLAFPVERGGCRAGAWWQSDDGPLPPPPSDEPADASGGPTPPAGATGTRPVEICLARGDADEAQLAAWLAGSGTLDPRLDLPLVPVGTAAPGEWTSATAVTAALFLRGCVGGDYRRLGALHLGPGALGLRERRDARGVPILELEARDALLETSEAAWAEVLAGCGGSAAGLPASPAPGESTLFLAAQRAPAPEPGTPEAALAALFDAIDALAASQQLGRGPARSLGQRVAKTGQRLRSGDSTSALRELARFEGRVAALAQRGQIAPESAADLRAGAEATAAAIALLATAPAVPPPDPDRSCQLAPAACPLEPCALTTYHVDPNDASRLGCGLALPGSAICAFATLGEALARAAEDARCGAELRAAPGVYAEDVELTRHTRIRGSGPRETTIRGTISHAGPHELRLEGLTVAPAGGRGVFVNDPCARTSLADVVVVGAREYGVRQRGGSLEFRNGAVSFTQSTPVSLQHGTGIYLSCGALAVLDDLNLLDNESAGLALANRGTEAQARDLLVSGTGVHPTVAADPAAAPAQYGAVQVHDGARLSGALLSILDNAIAGLQLTGEGTSATLRFVGVSRSTLAFGNEAIGVNLRALDGAALDLTHFTSSEAGDAGAQVARGGEADLHGLCLRDREEFNDEGELIVWECLEPTALISRNPVGANVQTEGFDLGRLQDWVFYHANSRNLDSTTLPLPTPLGALDD